MPKLPSLPNPPFATDERELLLGYLDYQRAAITRKLEDLGEEQARWRPDSKLISLLGIVNHLTHVEWRWIEGALRGNEVSRSEDEFTPGHEVTVAAAVAAYRDRAKETNDAVRAAESITVACGWQEGMDLRWVLVHLIEETARHAGHADATRELLDGTTG
jgi:uncharacterized damage-inducible protein DinB